MAEFEPVYEELDMRDLAHQALCKQCGATVVDRAMEAHLVFHELPPGEKLPRKWPQYG